MSMLYTISQVMLLQQSFASHYCIDPHQLKSVLHRRTVHLVAFITNFVSFNCIRFLSVGISIPLILLVESEKYTCNNPQV